MAEEWVKNSCGETRMALDARAEAEVQLGVLKEKQAKMAEQVKEALRARDSAKAGLKTTEKQVEEIRKELHYSEINLATEKQMVTSFAKNFARPGRLPNYSRRQLRPRSRLHMTWEYRKLKAVSQRSFLLWRGTTAISPRVKPWMSLESLLIPT